MSKFKLALEDALLLLRDVAGSDIPETALEYARMTIEERKKLHIRVIEMNMRDVMIKSRMRVVSTKTEKEEWTMVDHTDSS